MFPRGRLLGSLLGVLPVLAAEETPVFLGEDLLAWLVLALGGAMAAGSVMAVLRPPEQPKEGDLARAPMGRSVVMAVVGGVAAIWALASLLTG
jgi:hypothetical protein